MSAPAITAAAIKSASATSLPFTPEAACRVRPAAKPARMSSPLVIESSWRRFCGFCNQVTFMKLIRCHFRLVPRRADGVQQFVGANAARVVLHLDPPGVEVHLCLFDPFQGFERLLDLLHAGWAGELRASQCGFHL